jgi:uncharacterized membrane protein YfhO
VYYAHGWQATIDGVASPIIPVNYTLRGIEVPAGDHEIIFKFKPAVVAFGSKIALASSILLFLVLGLSLGRYFKNLSKAAIPSNE